MFDLKDCNAYPVAANCPAEAVGLMHTLRAESLVFAARDELLMPDTHHWAEHFYRSAPSPSHLVLFPEARHTDWGAPGPVSDTTMRTQMALLLARFKGMTGLDAYLPGGSALTDDPLVGLNLSK